MQLFGQWISNPDAIGSAIAINGPMGTGKCHGINTPILMYDGTIKMVQDVKIGDISAIYCIPLRDEKDITAIANHKTISPE